MHRQRMTVAHIRQAGVRQPGAHQPGADDQAAGAVEVMFLEAARIFKLATTGDDFEQMLETLNGARNEGHDVLVTTESIDSEIIVSVEA